MKGADKKKRDPADFSPLDDCILVFFIFVFLKLIGETTLSWWLILAPIWVPAALVIGIFLIAAVVYVIATIVTVLK